MRYNWNTWNAIRLRGGYNPLGLLIGNSRMLHINNIKIEAIFEKISVIEGCENDIHPTKRVLSLFLASPLSLSLILNLTPYSSIKLCRCMMPYKIFSLMIGISHILFFFIINFMSSFDEQSSKFSFKGFLFI